MRKKFNLLLLAAVCLIALGGISASAATGNFSFTPGSGNTYDSNYASKAGGSSYENCAYITPTYFSKTGTVYLWVKLKSSSIRTEETLFSSGSENNTRSLYYTSTASTGGSYHVGGKIGSVSSGSSMTVKGRFTP